MKNSMGSFTITLDKFEMFYLLESAFRGSHLRCGVIENFVNIYFDMFNEDERKFFYNQVNRIIFDNDFKPRSAQCGYDEFFMARYNPDNQYLLTVSDGKKTETVRAFKMDNELGEGKYYTKCNRYCAPEFVQKVEKLNL